MKIAIIGSAPSSIRLAPYGDPSWSIWGCSPGVYPIAGRIDVWFELHRWEPPVLGKADQQKPWFSPEYVGWMAQRPLVWMAEKQPEIPGSRPYPFDPMIRKYGSYWFTSTIAWMFSMAIEVILEARAAGKLGEDVIGLWGVDMAAVEEYQLQRPACQFFVSIAHSLGIQTQIPPESDLLVPPPLYGYHENTHRMIKLTERKRELDGRLQHARSMKDKFSHEEAFLQGALDDMNYHLQTWIHEGEKAYMTDYHNLDKPLFGAKPVEKLKAVE